MKTHLSPIRANAITSEKMPIRDRFLKLADDCFAEECRLLAPAPRAKERPAATVRRFAV